MNTPAIEVWPTKSHTADSKLSAVPSLGQPRERPRLRILYADDDVSIRRIAKILLTRSGYQVDTAADGSEALGALHNTPYHLLITDHAMPRLTGLQLAAQARLEGMNLPIVLVSGSEEALEDTSSESLNLSARLAKPFNAEILLATVVRCLNCASQPARLQEQVNRRTQEQPWLE